MLQNIIKKKLHVTKKSTRKHQYAPERYRKYFIENELSEEEKNKKHQYARNLYNNLSRKKRQKAPIWM